MRAAGASKFSAELPECFRAFDAELEFVQRLLRRSGVGRADADDLAQEIFLVVWRRWRDYDPGRPLRPWLAGITFRVVHDHFRRTRREVPSGFVDREDQCSPHDHLTSARARALVLRALCALPERQRVPMILHELEGMSIPEVADALLVPASTLYSRLKKAHHNFARQVRRLQLQSPALARQASELAALLEAERAPRPEPPERRRRVMTRVRALMAAPRPPVAPQPRRSPWPLVAAGLAAAIALAFVFTRPRPSPPHAQAVSALARELVGYWRFDEAAGTVARDRSGGENHCQLRPGAGWTTGVVGGALALDGRAWLDCPRVEPLASLDRELSISLWVKPDAARAARQVFVARQLGDGPADYFLLALDDDTLVAQSNLWESATKRRVNRRPGTWFHVAVVQKADGRRTLYVDGAAIGRSNKSVPASLGGGTTRLTIGGAINGPDRAVADERFSGALDELAIYRRALSEGEVRALAGGARPEL